MNPKPCSDLDMPPPIAAPLGERISISPSGRLWAIRHGGSYLGYAASSDEAARIGRHLADWFIGQGRPADVVIDLAPLVVEAGWEVRGAIRDPDRR